MIVKKEDLGLSLGKDRLFELTEVSTVKSATFHDFSSLIKNETSIGQCKPKEIVQIDPRSNERIIYNPDRAKRPHDNHSKNEKSEVVSSKPCVICSGKSTGIIDIAPLEKEGTYTFINKNLFPVLYPNLSESVEVKDRVLSNRKAETTFNIDPESMVGGSKIDGFHLLQWTSNVHNDDWHNMSSFDRVVCVKALARLEKALLYSQGPYLPNKSWSENKDDKTSGFVSIIKNYGRLVGGSLEHGHQQIIYTNIMPLKFRHNLHFLKKHGETYSDYMLRTNPSSLTVKEYEWGRLIVPYYMRRPYDMQFLIKDTSKKYLHELNEKEVEALSDALHLALAAIIDIMPKIGRETAYNFVIHNGPGAGLYVEFLPYTQEYGGYEHTGIYLCQGWPQDVADSLQKYFNKLEKKGN